MRYVPAAMLLACALILAAPMAQARSSHSHGSHSATSGNYIIGKCKSSTCFKKHPSGRFAIPKRKKRS